LEHMRHRMSTAPWEFGIQKELMMVDERLHQLVQSQEHTLTEASLHVIDAGGKRLRPTVTILSYKSLGGSDTGTIVDIATGFELIHSATLIHDDINDGGVTRRGRETVFKKYGLHQAIVTGDFLFVKAFGIGGRYDRTVVETTADACASVAEGEMLQNRYRHRHDLTVDEYMKVIDRKTAQPIRAGAMVGAYLAGGEAEQIRALGGYGLNLGLAFQMVDDVLDFTGDPVRTGKPPGTDLKEGCLTLPTLIAMSGSDGVRERILKVIAMETPSAEAVRDCAKEVLATGAIDEAMCMARERGQEALRHLDDISDTVYSRSLRELVGRVLDRDS
jgi:octaprenyl-diphosphate synthase